MWRTALAIALGVALVADAHTVLAQHHGSMMQAGGAPTLAGQDAFGAIAERSTSSACASTSWT